MTRARVVTYQSSRGSCISLTEEQEQMLRAARVWPRDYSGEEYATVSRGQHWGTPSHSDTEIAALIERLSD